MPPLPSLLTSDKRLAYRSFSLAKRNGGRRQVAAPSGVLKKLQRRLLDKYLSGQEIHHAATAFRRGQSIASHAGRHLGQAIVVTVDLADFFPATSSARVRGWFLEQGWRGEALRALMRLCVYQGGLPQGAPTSPVLSNLVNLPFDREMAELASRHGARFSRYADDLAFSWNVGVEPTGFRCAAENCIERFGYRIQLSKGWRCQTAEELPEVTGLVLNGSRLLPSRQVLKKIRRLRRWWRTPTKLERARMSGYRGFLRMLRRSF